MVSKEITHPVIIITPSLSLLLPHSPHPIPSHSTTTFTFTSNHYYPSTLLPFPSLHSYSLHYYHHPLTIIIHNSSTNPVSESIHNPSSSHPHTLLHFPISPL